MTRSWPRLLIGGFSMLLAACGSDGGDAGGVDAGLGGGLGFEPILRPTTVYTGFDGQGTFRVPVYVERLSGDITWATDDAAIATVASVEASPELGGNFGRQWAMIEATGSGTTTLRATAGDVELTAELVIETYTPAQLAAGMARYTDPDGTGDRVSCASCHQQADGVDHTPTEMSANTDAVLLEVIETGAYPDRCFDADNRACECGSSGCSLRQGYQLSVAHAWALTPEEKDGIVPYLRSLAPSGF